MLGVCQLVGHRLVVPLLLRPQLVIHWLVMHVLAKDSPGWPGDVSVTDLPCVDAIYMEDHSRQTTDSCKKLMVSVCETTLFSPLRHRASLGAILAPCKRLGYGILSSKIQDGRRLVHPGFSPRAPWQQLISARLPPYVETGYRKRRMGTFGRYSSTLARGVRGQCLGLFFCIGSIGACPENRIFSP